VEFSRNRNLGGLKNGPGLRRTGTISSPSGQEAQRQGTGWSDDLVPFASNSAAGGMGGGGGTAWPFSSTWVIRLSSMQLKVREARANLPCKFRQV